MSSNPLIITLVANMRLVDWVGVLTIAVLVAALLTSVLFIRLSELFSGPVQVLLSLIAVCVFAWVSFQIILLAGGGGMAFPH